MHVRLALLMYFDPRDSLVIIRQRLFFLVAGVVLRRAALVRLELRDRRARRRRRVPRVSLGLFGGPPELRAQIAADPELVITLLIVLSGTNLRTRVRELSEPLAHDLERHLAGRTPDAGRVVRNRPMKLVVVARIDDVHSLRRPPINAHECDRHAPRRDHTLLHRRQRQASRAVEPHRLHRDLGEERRHSDLSPRVPQPGRLSDCVPMSGIQPARPDVLLDQLCALAHERLLLSVPATRNAQHQLPIRLREIRAEPLADRCRALVVAVHVVRTVDPQLAARLMNGIAHRRQVLARDPLEEERVGLVAPGGVVGVPLGFEELHAHEQVP